MSSSSRLLLTLGRRRRLDADAAAFISARQAAGETWTGAMKSALDTYVESEKAAGRWTSLKRLYLPTSGIAAANAIDLVTRSSGTWNGSVTHAAGYVQGDGSTGFLATGTSPDSVGISSTSGQLFALVLQADSRTDNRFYLGARTNDVPAAGECSLYQATATVINSIIGREPSTPVGSVTVTTRDGILHSNRSGSSITASQRKTSGITRGSAGSGTSGVTSQPFNILALRSAAANSLFTNARVGAAGFGLGLASNTEVDAFTLSLKTLWESLTGLSLP